MSLCEQQGGIVLDVFFARQPILDVNLKLFGYELLFRPNAQAVTSGDSVLLDGDRATATILNAVSWEGIERVTKGTFAFVNFTEQLLLDGIATMYPQNFLVVEVLESVNIDEGVLEALRELKRKGYRVALDDYVFREKDASLLQLCDIVKVEVDGSDKSFRNVRKVAKMIGTGKCKLLAEKVETEENYLKAKKLGCTLFQGFFFAKPRMVTSRIMSPLKVNRIQLIHEVLKPDADFDKLAAIIKNDVALTYKTLRLVNSVHFAPIHKVKSINQAIAMLGHREMRKWLAFLSLGELCEDKPSELVVMSLTRAHFCEAMVKGTRRRKDADAYFLAGLFSLLDAMTDTELEQCLDSVLVPQLTRDALLEEGNYGRHLLDLVIALEYGNWNQATKLCKLIKTDETRVANTYEEALAWAQSFI